MNEESLSMGIFEEYKQRMADEHCRINHRLSGLEETVKEIGELTSSVKELAVNMGTMAVNLKEQNERLKAIESRDGDMWRDVIKIAVSAVIGGVIGVVISSIF